MHATTQPKPFREKNLTFEYRLVYRRRLNYPNVIYSLQAINAPIIAKGSNGKPQMDSRLAAIRTAYTTLGVVAPETKIPTALLRIVY